jgi:hypothetical protein
MFKRNVGQSSMFPASPNVQQHNSAQQSENEIWPTEQSVSGMFIYYLRTLQHDTNETAYSRQKCMFW